MRREAVDSSSIASIGYDEASGTLEVGFASGEIYEYFNVPKDVYERFRAADSKGRFFHLKIKDKYRYARV